MPLTEPLRSKPLTSEIMKHRLNAILVSSALLACATAAGPKRPNILLILSDDQGYCELGSFMDFADPDSLGAMNPAKLRAIKKCTDERAPIEVCFEPARKCMPTVDSLAAEGMRFTSFYAAPTCAPARAALMSGRYPQGFGIYANDDLENPRAAGMSLDVDLPVRLFKEAGYLTGISGKWHLGETQGYLPHERGFDFFFGFCRAHTEKYNSKILQKNGQPVPADGWLADQITDEAVSFLKQAEAVNKPFFLHVAYNEPHGPVAQPPQPYIDHFKSGSKIVDLHFATIYGMDCGIARILEQIKAMGQLDNTLIFYASDNGLAQASYHRGFRMSEYNVPVPGNGPFSGCKWTPWDGGVRTACIVKLPGGRHASSDALVSMLDVMPTALDYAGIEAPAIMRFDGRSFLPILQGKSEGDPDRTLFWACDSKTPFGNFSEADGKLTKEFKAKGDQVARQDKNPPAWYVRTPEWKLMGWDTNPPALIDIRNDLGEKHDMAAQHPEVVKDLSARFAAWFARQAKPMFYSETQWRKFNEVK